MHTFNDTSSTRFIEQKMSRELLNAISREAPNSQAVLDIRNMMRLIAESMTKKGSDIGEYSAQRSNLIRIFRLTSGDAYDRDAISIRLTQLDSQYSTNATKTYFSIESMAETINNLGSETEANKFFDAVAEMKFDKIDDFFNNRHFGIRKNLSQGPTMPSLLSKYAYFCCLIRNQSDVIGFPIFDSLALYSFPFVFRMLWPNSANDCELKKLLTSMSKSFTTYLLALTIICKALNLQKDRIGMLQPFDILDAYLWRMGKLSKGNLSLIIGRNAYKEVIDGLNLGCEKDTETVNEYYKRLNESNVSWTDKTIFDLFKDCVKYSEYPGIISNTHLETSPISKEKLLSPPSKGSINAMILFNMMKKSPFENISNQETKAVMSSLYKHWDKYYNK